MAEPTYAPYPPSLTPPAPVEQAPLAQFPLNPVFWIRTLLVSYEVEAWVTESLDGIKRSKGNDLLRNLALLAKSNRLFVLVTNQQIPDATLVLQYVESTIYQAGRTQYTVPGAMRGSGAMRESLYIAAVGIPNVVPCQGGQ